MNAARALAELLAAPDGAADAQLDFRLAPTPIPLPGATGGLVAATAVQ